MPLRPLLILISFLLITCGDPFVYSPFEINVPDELRNTTQANLSKLAKIDTGSGEPFKVALLSDPHYHLNEFRDALAIIDKDPTISFIIVAGDLTENGLLQEYKIFHSMMSGLHKPYFTVIGNHDYLSNGGEIYQELFGPANYTFTFSGVKFVMFDNVKWESNKQPDYPWLENNMGVQSADDPASKLVIPVSHIPPFDGQLQDDLEQFRSILTQNSIRYSIHGHKHTYSLNSNYGDGVEYLTIGSPQHRSYVEMLVEGDELTFKKIEY